MFSFLRKSYLQYLCIFLLSYVCLLGITFIYDYSAPANNGGGILSFIHQRNLLTLSLILTLHSIIFSSKKLYLIEIFSLGILFSSIFLIKNFVGESWYIKDIKYFFLFSFSLLNMYLFISTLFNKSYYSKVISYLILFIISLPIFIIWCYYFISHTFFNVTTLLAILQTNFGESKEYLQMHNDSMLYLSIIIFMLMLSSIFYLNKKLHLKYKMHKYLKLLLIILLILDISMIYKYKENIITDIFWQTNAYIEEYQKFNTEREHRKLNLTTANTTSSGIYVLVIGESQSKKHMSIYGYDRETTPWLNTKLNDPNFILFNNAYSCHTHTVQVLTYALTAKNQYNNLNLSTSPSLIEAVESAGYETVWLSNQAQYGAWDTPTSAIASDANQQDWINHNLGETTRTNCYDLKLTDSLSKIQLSDKMLIVIHLMGNHGVYSERYPSDFNKYTSKNTINEYDNSILYNDFVVQNIYDKVRKLPNFKGLIYFSDHADDVDNDLGHDASNFTPEMTYIPFYMYFSDDYLATHSEKIANLKAHKNAYFTNDLIFNTVLGILDIKIDNLYEPENDITSSHYDTTPSRFKTLYNQKSILQEEN